jgi:hypothetical protein
MSPRSLVARSVFGILVVTVVLTACRRATAAPDAAKLGPVEAKALQFFAVADAHAWDERLRQLRPAAAPLDRRTRSLAKLRKDGLIEPSSEQQSKLGVLRPVLAYLDRETVVEVKLLRLDVAWAGFLEGAAVLITPNALDLLDADELQAVVAHELAHEYFSEEYGAAREARRYETVREIELRCDAVAIVTLSRLGGNREALLSGVAKLVAFNEGHGFPNSRDLSPSWEERRRFDTKVAELVR